MASTDLVASYFGGAEKPLFGCSSVPRPGRSRSSAALICQPVGHEYINCHRALRQLATRLANAGFPALRFDYLGCGDSRGDSTQGRVSEWMENLVAAISEIRRQTNSARVCLIGLRLGASLALLAAARRNDIAGLVLWDPVINGRDYLTELISLNRRLLRFRPKPTRHRQPEWPKDVIGFPLTHELYDDIEQIDLLKIRAKPSGSIFMIDSQNSPYQSDLTDTLGRWGASVTHQHINAPPIWVPTVDGGLQVPTNVLQLITSWAERSLP